MILDTKLAPSRHRRIQSLGDPLPALSHRDLAGLPSREPKSAVLARDASFALPPPGYLSSLSQFRLLLNINIHIAPSSYYLYLHSHTPNHPPHRMAVPRLRALGYGA